MSETTLTPVSWKVADAEYDWAIRMKDQCDLLLEQDGTESAWTFVGTLSDDPEDARAIGAIVALVHPLHANLVATAPKLLEVLIQIEASLSNLVAETYLSRADTETLSDLAWAAHETIAEVSGGQADLKRH